MVLTLTYLHWIPASLIMLPDPFGHTCGGPHLPSENIALIILNVHISLQVQSSWAKNSEGFIPLLMAGGGVCTHHGTSATKHPQCSGPCTSIEHLPAHRKTKPCPPRTYVHILQVMHTSCSTHVCTQPTYIHTNMYISLCVSATHG